MKVGIKVYWIQEYKVKELTVTSSAGKTYQAIDDKGEIFRFGYEDIRKGGGRSGAYLSKIVSMDVLEETLAKALTGIREEIKEHKLSFFNKGAKHKIEAEDIEKELWPYDDKELEKENQ